VTGGVKVSQHGAYQVATMPSVRGGFMSWAKAGEILGPDPVREPGEVWFEFGRTRDEAAAKLLRELGLAH
jgi:hypothetical protein